MQGTFEERLARRRERIGKMLRDKDAAEGLPARVASAPPLDCSEFEFPFPARPLFVGTLRPLAPPPTARDPASSPLRRLSAESPEHTSPDVLMRDQGQRPSIFSPGLSPIQRHDLSNAGESIDDAARDVTMLAHAVPPEGSSLWRASTPPLDSSSASAATPAPVSSPFVSPPRPFRSLIGSPPRVSPRRPFVGHRASVASMFAAADTPSSAACSESAVQGTVRSSRQISEADMVNRSIASGGRPTMAYVPDPFAYVDDAEAMPAPDPRPTPISPPNRRSTSGHSRSLPSSAPRPRQLAAKPPLRRRASASHSPSPSPPPPPPPPSQVTSRPVSRRLSSKSPSPSPSPPPPPPPPPQHPSRLSSPGLPTRRASRSIPPPPPPLPSPSPSAFSQPPPRPSTRSRASVSSSPSPPPPPPPPPVTPRPLSTVHDTSAQLSKSNLPADHQTHVTRSRASSTPTPRVANSPQPSNSKATRSMRPSHRVSQPTPTKPSSPLSTRGEGPSSSSSPRRAHSACLLFSQNSSLDDPSSHSTPAKRRREESRSNLAEDSPASAPQPQFAVSSAPSPDVQTLSDRLRRMSTQSSSSPFPQSLPPPLITNRTQSLFLLPDDDTAVRSNVQVKFFRVSKVAAMERLRKKLFDDPIIDDSSGDSDEDTPEMLELKENLHRKPSSYLQHRQDHPLDPTWSPDMTDDSASEYSCSDVSSGEMEEDGPIESAIATSSNAEPGREVQQMLNLRQDRRVTFEDAILQQHRELYGSALSSPVQPQEVQAPPLQPPH